MSIARIVEMTVDDIPVGEVFTVGSLNLPADASPNVKVKLNRMVKTGRLQKLANGKYYKAKESVFGRSLPSTYELVKDILYPDGKIAGYLTGSSIWASMNLTTQFSGNITVGVNRRKASITRGGQKILFMVQPNRITRDNVHLLQILDALKLIKKIPDTTVNESMLRLENLILALNEKDLKSIMKLALNYPPRVRALLGAILDNGRNVELSEILYLSLNHLSEYNLGITADTGLNLDKWHIK